VGILIVAAIIKSSVGSALNDNKEEKTVKENSVLKLVINGNIYEREKENPFKELGAGPFGEPDGLGLNTLAKKLSAAKKDDKIKGLYLNIKNLRSGFATTQELRALLADFKSSGKFVYCYAEYFNQQEYYLASVADKVFLNPQGGMEWKGLYVGLLFFKKALEKLDIDVQVFRHGKFKSAVEPFILDKMSESNRLQTETFVGSIWNAMLLEISASRGIDVDELNRMANTLEIQFPEDAKGKLVDVLAYEDEVISAMKKKTGIKDADKMIFANFSDYTPKAKLDSKLNSSKVAVIYAVGGISSGEGDDEEIGSDRIAKAIKEARLDSKVKAIVLRVNSPGGSALASDVIWREVVLARKAKPTVVSMGDYAASGGYYISCAADRIFAQPNTITGSIGVFGMLPNLQKMLENKLGITIDTINTNKHSDYGNGLRKVNDYEYDVIQRSVERIYDHFTGIVAEGRKMDKADVDSIGQGRVWSGSDAKRLKLVDEMGGLSAAITYAAGKAKLGDYKVVELPKQKGPFDAFFSNKESEFESRMLKRNLGSTYTYFKHLQRLLSMKGVQARLPFELITD
jgi:protease-4